MKNRKWMIIGAILLCVLLVSCTGRQPSQAGVLSVTPTPVPTATPVPTPSPRTVDVEGILSDMTLREKVGQLFFVRPDALAGGQIAARADDSSAPGIQTMTETLGNMLLRYPVGGVVIFGKNISSPRQLSGFIASMQDASKVPLILAVDEEGGDVTRLAAVPAFRLPRFESAETVGRSADTGKASEMGRSIGGYLRRYGFTMDFAPVADVATNPENTVIGSRAFGSDPRVVSEMAAAMAEGLLSRGIIPVYKHFPGHGDTPQDSHLGLAVTDKNEKQLKECEWQPYLTGDLSRCAVMVGHIAVPAVTGDMTPASLSQIMVNGCLRQELGFDGLVITDSLSMGGIEGGYSPGEAAMLALQAGCDVLLMPQDLFAAYNAVLSAVETGELTEERVDASVRRILEYKAMAGLL